MFTTVTLKGGGQKVLNGLWPRLWLHGPVSCVTCLCLNSWILNSVFYTTDHHTSIHFQVFLLAHL
jgi:hypothetical protein